MLFLLSPAKSLDWQTPIPPSLSCTEPDFLPDAAALIDVLKHQTVPQLRQLMRISEQLAEQNAQRYEDWRQGTPTQARPAVLAFDGDVYRGLDAASLDRGQLHWLQDHACILSGLYGVLRPLDRIQPYRLEMGTRLPTERGADLYDYWGSRLAQWLNHRQTGQDAPVVINLASQEYARAVDRRRLQARVLDIRFEDWKRDRYKVISFYAKRARGLMLRFAAQHGASRPEQLHAFDLEGYRLAAADSSDERLVFRRRAEPAT